VVEKNEMKYPMLARVARRALGIPATSAPVERLFSTAGLVLSHKRCSLSPDMAADLIFLHETWELTAKLEAEAKVKVAAERDARLARAAGAHIVDVD